MGTRPAPPPGLERKNLHTFVKVLDPGQGIVEMFVAGTGNRDEGGDKFLPGAFSKSIAERKPKGIHGHDWLLPTSKALDLQEIQPGDQRLPQKMRDAGAGGVYIKAQYNLETQIGREAFSNVRFYGEEQEWSVGYIAEEVAPDSAIGERDIKTASLWEFSDVLWGMNPVTSTVSVKDRKAAQEKGWVEPPEGSFDAIIEDVQEAIQEAEGNAYWPSIVATFPDRVVYYLYSNSPGIPNDDDAYQRSYSRAADGTVTLGDKAPVEIVQTIVAGDPDEPKTRPEPQAKTEPAPGEKAADTSEGPHAYAASEDSKLCKTCGGRSDNWMHDADAAKQLADAEAAIKALEIVEASVPLLRTKAGRVLAKRNEDRLTHAHGDIAAVLSEIQQGVGGPDEATPAAKTAEGTEGEKTGEELGELDPAELLEFQRLAAGIEPETEEAHA